MKQLTILRHAKSSWDLPEMEDIYRPLNARGVKNAYAIGDELAIRGVFPDVVITSPAVRAMNTAIIISRKLDFPLERIESNQRLYEASVADILDVIASVEDSISHLMVVAHNPTLTMLINRMQKKPLDNLPTCGVYHLELDISSWSEIYDAKGKVQFALFPKQLKK
jgi:phosphohistidine phosphatase